MSKPNSASFMHILEAWKMLASAGPVPPPTMEWCLANCDDEAEAVLYYEWCQQQDYVQEHQDQLDRIAYAEWLIERADSEVAMWVWKFARRCVEVRSPLADFCPQHIRDALLGGES